MLSFACLLCLPESEASNFPSLLTLWTCRELLAVACFKGRAVNWEQAIRSIKFVSLWPPIPGFKQCCTRRQHLRFPRAQDHTWRQRLRCGWPENQPCLKRCPCGPKDLAWRNDLRRPRPQTEPQQPRSTRPERLPGLAINSILFCFLFGKNHWFAWRANLWSGKHFRSS